MRALPSTPSARIVTTILLFSNQRLIRHVVCLPSGLQSRKTFNICRKAVIQREAPTSSIMCYAWACSSMPERDPEEKVVSKRRSSKPQIPRYLPSWEWLLNLIAKVYGPTQQRRVVRSV